MKPINEYKKLEKQYTDTFKDIGIPYSALTMMDHYKTLYKQTTEPRGQNLDDLIGFVDCNMDRDLYMIKVNKYD